MQSVEGVKVTVAPQKGTGAQSECVTQIELSGSASLAKVAAALESAKTPHSAQCAPGVAAIVPGKLKPGTTPQAITDALKKAGLTD